MRITVTEKMKKKIAKGQSVLKTCRTSAGGAKGMMAGGLVFLVFGVFAAFPMLISGFDRGGLLFFLILGLPGLLLIGIGAVLQSKKAAEYVKFYSKETGYSESDILLADQELLMPQTVVIGNPPSKDSKKNAIGCYITEHYLVSVTTLSCYVRKLEDMRAAFYSEELPGIDRVQPGAVFISKKEAEEGEPRINPFTYRKCGGEMNARLNKESCAEIAEELEKRAPFVITSQTIMRGGVQYDLMGLNHWQEDWREIMRKV